MPWDGRAAVSGGTSDTDVLEKPVSHTVTLKNSRGVACYRPLCLLADFVSLF